MLRSARGFTLIELLIVVTLIGILAALAAPFMMAAKAASNEASAIGSMKAVNAAQAAFSTSCGGNFFTTDIMTLIADGYISPDTALLPKSGFTLTLMAGAGAAAGNPDCMGRATETGYYSSAVPGGPEAGTRGFATNQAGVVWEDRTGVAPVEPFVISPTVSPIQ